MYKKALSVVALSLMTMALSAQSSLAKTVVVGASTCNPGPVHYATIQDAVNAATDGSTVLVCPGLYPEQVVIQKPLTVKGIADGGAGAAVITVPAGGLVPNATTLSYGVVAAQLLVQNTSTQPVTVRNLTVDGAGSTCPVGANRTVGIQLLNIGDPTWEVGAGYIQNVVVRNQFDGCNSGQAIASENSYVTIGPNEIHGFDLEGVVQHGGNNNINGNTIQSGLTGVALFGALHSGVLNNTLSTARGIDVDATSTDLTISNNTLGPFVGTGILLEGSSGNVVKNNKINASSVGIWVFNATGNVVQGNVVSNAQMGLVLQKSGGGNSFSSNTVNEAGIGLFLYQNGTSVDVLTPNTFYNVTNITVTN
jgi:parallel beta-helix repeat protein